MKPGTTTRTWTEFQARADLNNNIDFEVFPDILASLIDPHPHLALITWASGVEEGYFIDDYYIIVKFKSDLPEEQASDAMRDAIYVASPTVVTSWFMLKVSQFETSIDVADGIAKDTVAVANEATDAVKQVADIAVEVGKASPNLVANFHWIALSAAAIAVVAGALYFAPIIMARR